MNKKKFTHQCRKDGWKVQKPDNWEYVEDREIKGRVHKIYSLSVVKPDKSSGIVEVAILGEGEVNEEGKLIERVIPLDWESAIEPFTDSLRDFLDDEEGKQDVFAIKVIEVQENDELAEIVVYNKSGKEVVAERNVVRRRKGKFQMRAITSNVT